MQTSTFYENFERVKTWSVVKKLEYCHTSKHGCWLNIAENGLSTITRLGVTGRRFASVNEIRKELSAWQNYTNTKQRVVDWQFKVDDARVKLKSNSLNLEV